MGSIIEGLKKDERKNEHRTSNVQHRMKKKKQISRKGTKAQGEKRLKRKNWKIKSEETEFKKSELLDDILQEPEELIKIFVTSIKTAETKQK